VSLRGAEASTEVDAPSGELRKILSLVHAARPGLWNRTQWMLIGGFILLWVGFGLVYCVGNMGSEHWVDIFSDFGVTTAMCTIFIAAIGGIGAVVLLGYHVMPNVGFASGAGACLFLLTIVFFCFGVYFGTEKLREYHDPPHGASHFHRLPANYFIGSDPRLAGRQSRDPQLWSGGVGGHDLDEEVVKGLSDARFTTRL
jgi:magnesium-transporting ATPase (P-type)